MDFELNNINILITGAAGTIGTGLVDFFSSYNVNCYALDRNENDLYLLSRKNENKNFNIEYIYGDLQDESLLHLFQNYEFILCFTKTNNKWFNGEFILQYL